MTRTILALSCSLLAFQSCQTHRPSSKGVPFEKRQTLEDTGFQPAQFDQLIDLIKNEAPSSSAYYLSESAINSFGYRLMRTNNRQEVLQFFEVNTQLYPTAYNTFDSYGECLLAMGFKQKAKAAYQKSVALNPDNVKAKKVILQLENEGI